MSKYPWPSEWTYPRARGWVFATCFLVLGLPGIPVAVRSFFVEDALLPLEGAAVAFTGVAFALIGVSRILRPGPRAVQAGAEGVAFRASPLQVGVLIAFVGGISCLLLHGALELQGTLDRGLATGLVTGLAASSGWLAKRMHAGAVILTPERLIVDHGTRSARIAWRDIDRCEPGELGYGVLTVRVIGRDGLSRSLIHPRSYEVDPRVLYWAIAHYAAHPGDREELTSVAALERIAIIAASPLR